MTPRVPAPEDALRLFRSRFLNRTDVVSICAPWGKPCPIYPDGTLDDLLLGHVFGDRVPPTSITYRNRHGAGAVRGRFRVGAYCPGLDNETRWLCLDFDGPGHADPLADPQGTAVTALAAFETVGLPAYLECSGSGMGWHLWCFFDPPLPAPKARKLGYALAPKNAPLAGRPNMLADPRLARGIEVFPKQDKLRRGEKKGLGSPVWLPWWSGAPDGANAFYRRGESGQIERYVPTELAAATSEAIEHVLASIPAEREGSGGGQRRGRPAKRAQHDLVVEDAEWAAWRHRVLAALPLEAVYGPWLTGNVAGVGWLECRDPASPSGDQRPSAGVADGNGDAERGTFHSFISGSTMSVFDFLIAHGGAPDFRVARQRLAELSGVLPPTPRGAASSPPPRPGARRPKIRVSNRPLREAIDEAAGGSSPASPAGIRRPEICVSGRQLSEIVIEAGDVLVTTNERRVRRAAAGEVEDEDAPLFRRGNVLVRLERVEDAAPMLSEVTEPVVYGLLLREIDWVRETEHARLPVHPPDKVARDLITFPPSSFPQVSSVITTPTFGGDGQLLRSPGVHKHDRLWLEPAPSLQLGDIPGNPTTDEVAAARSWFFDELLVDFPFVSSSDRAHALAALLLPFTRRLIDGCTPLHIVEAPAIGAGKGLLCNLVAIAMTGDVCSARTLPDSDDEVRKMLTAELATGRPIVLLDNANDRQTLAAPPLAAVLTAPSWTDRVLGRTQMITVPNKAMWMLTGNNPKLSRDIARRSIRIRIDPKVDRPWLRAAFKHDPLETWAKHHRNELVRAALILVQAWLAAGRPLSRARLGSFQTWAAVMGGVLDVAGVGGFLGNLDELYANADAEGEAWRAFTLAWWDEHGPAEVHVARLAELCEKQDLMSATLGDGNARSQQSRLGRALRSARDRVFGHLQIVVGSEDRNKRTLYALRQVADINEPTSPRPDSPCPCTHYDSGET